MHITSVRRRRRGSSWSARFFDRLRYALDALGVSDTRYVIRPAPGSGLALVAGPRVSLRSSSRRWRASSPKTRRDPGLCGRPTRRGPDAASAGERSDGLPRFRHHHHPRRPAGTHRGPRRPAPDRTDDGPVAAHERRSSLRRRKSIRGDGAAFHHAQRHDVDRCPCTCPVARARTSRAVDTRALVFGHQSTAARCPKKMIVRQVPESSPSYLSVTGRAAARQSG